MKIFKVLIALGLLAGICLADSYTIPRDNNTNNPSNANLVGATSKYSTTYTTTCITAVPAIVYGMSMYTELGLDTSSYAVIYDTNSAKANNAFSNTIYDNYRVTSNLVFSSVTVVTSKVQRTEFTFNPPIICENGVYVALPGTTSKATTGIQWSIVYRNRIKGN